MGVSVKWFLLLVNLWTVAGPFHTEFHPVGPWLIGQICTAGKEAQNGGRLDIWAQGCKAQLKLASYTHTHTHTHTPPATIHR